MLTAMIDALIQPNYISTYMINKERNIANIRVDNCSQNNIQSYKKTNIVDEQKTSFKAPDAENKIIIHKSEFNYEPINVKLYIGSLNNEKFKGNIENNVGTKHAKYHANKKYIKSRMNALKLYAKLYRKDRKGNLTKIATTAIFALIIGTIGINKIFNLIYCTHNIYLYLYLISQIINYKYKYKDKMNGQNNIIDINWKTNIKIYDTIDKYFYWISKNRIYFITSKLYSLLFNKISMLEEITWHFAKRNKLFEKLIKIELKQEGIKLLINICDTNRDKDIIWCKNTKIQIKPNQIIALLEINDLLKSNILNLFPPKENTKFNKKILNMNKEDIWIKDGIVGGEYEYQLWQLTEEVEDEDSESDM